MPLFRWEFLRAPHGDVPGAHFQIHAHRDEAVYLLVCGEGNRRVNERAAQIDARKPRVPQVSDLHFPLGGPRFRPCLEDVLQFLIEEFSIDHEEGARQAIEEGRRTWRRFFELLGYKVEPPYPRPPESSKLSMY